jgi:hypothetical protein
VREARIVAEGLGAAPDPLPTPKREKANPNVAWRRRAALAWGGVGFIAGAVFWHLVGLGSFLSAVMLDRAPSAQADVLSALPLQATADAPPAIVIDTNRCTMLALDRRSNLTLAQPCPPQRLALRFGLEVRSREDLAGLERP